jgi:hypothetical protein
MPRRPRAFVEGIYHLLGACRYLAHNPVEAGFAAHPFAWPWSSAAASAGLERPRLQLDQAPLRAAVGGSPDWRRRCRDYPTPDRTQKLDLRVIPPAVMSRQTDVSRL